MREKRGSCLCYHQKNERGNGIFTGENNNNDERVSLGESKQDFLEKILSKKFGKVKKLERKKCGDQSD